MNKKLPFFLLAVVVLNVATVRSQQKPQPLKTAKVRTESNGLTTRPHAVEEVLKMVQGQTKKIPLRFSDMRKLEAGIHWLGENRASEAAGFLVDYIDLKGTGISLELSPLQIYPSVGALIEIGNPSIEAILRRLRPLTSEAPEYPERDLHLFAYVIRQVDGDEVGLFRLQLAAKNAQGTHKVNLLNLIDIYKLNEDETQIRRAIEVIPAG